MRTTSAVLAAAGFVAAFTTGCRSGLAGPAVRQSGPANVYGLVQAGPHPSHVAVEQRGAFNVLGVMQATPDASLSASQRGVANVAVVRQYGIAAGFPSRGGMP